MRTHILAACLALVIVPAFAQAPLTIDRARGMAAAGMAPFTTDMEQLRKQCPDLKQIVDMTPEELGELSTSARALHIEGGALWLRRNDSAIAQCLAKEHRQ